MANCIYKYKGKEYTKEEFYSLVRSTMVQPRTVQKYNTDQNDFVEFIENYMVGRNKTYKETLAAYEKYLRSQNQNKSEQ